MLPGMPDRRHQAGPRDDDGDGCKAAAKVWKPTCGELGTQAPGLVQESPSLDQAFIGGTVVFRDTDECADGAIARIVSDGRDLAQAVANNYGDFRIDGLSGGHYELAVVATGYDSVTLAVDLVESKSLGVIFLERQSNGQ